MPLCDFSIKNKDIARNLRIMIYSKIEFKQITKYFAHIQIYFLIKK